LDETECHVRRDGFYNGIVALDEAISAERPIAAVRIDDDYSR
jgi:hypothetical protein